MIQNQVITDHKVLPLSVLREKYIRKLEEQNQPKENFRSEKLKKRLEKDVDISPPIEFSKIEWKGCVSFWLVFSSKLPVAKAVAASYLLATKDHLNDTATYLRDSILTAFRKSKDMPWLPTLDDVKRLASEPLPEELERFLCLVFSGNEPEIVQDERTKRFVFFIGQDVCRAVSQGRWNLQSTF